MLWRSELFSAMPVHRYEATLRVEPQIAEFFVTSFYEFRRKALHAEHVYSTVCPSATNLYVGFLLSSVRKVHILYNSCPAISASWMSVQTAVPLATLKHITYVTHLGEILHAFLQVMPLGSSTAVL